ncbi:MAG: hypothetical protein V5A55_03490 [Halovenus sp.]
MDQEALPILLLVTATVDLECGWGRFLCFRKEIQLTLEFGETMLQTLCPSPDSQGTSLNVIDGSGTPEGEIQLTPRLT